MSRVRASPAASKPCKVCLLLPPSEAALVEKGILIGWSPRSIAARFNGITRRDVQRHMKCVVNETKKAN